MRVQKGGNKCTKLSAKDGKTNASDNKRFRSVSAATSGFFVLVHVPILRCASRVVPRNPDELLFSQRGASFPCARRLGHLFQSEKSTQKLDENLLSKGQLRGFLECYTHDGSLSKGSLE